MQDNDHVSERLSPWWRHSVIIVLVIGFSILIWLAIRTYDTAPPIPKRVLTLSGVTIYTGEDIVHGQQVFLKYGLMENGTIWGHGAYLGPDFSAEYLHTLVLRGSELLAQQKYNRSFAELGPDKHATILGELRKDLRDNSYD